MRTAAGVDLIAVIEVAYDTTLDEAAWLARLAKLMTPLATHGGEVMPFFFALDEARRHVAHTEFAGPTTAFTSEHLNGIHRHARGVYVRRAYECAVLETFVRAIGEKWAKQAMLESGLPAENVLGLRANDQARSGALFCTPVGRAYRIPQRDRVLWPRIAAHVGAGLRLRRRLAVAPKSEPAAILSSSGSLEHGGAPAIAARADLRDAVRGMDRARGRVRRLDPVAATEAWQAMVQGEWSLVDWLDHDGKRFVLAHDNQHSAEVDALRPRAPQDALSPREWQAMACAAMGHSNKLIAYDLGLSQAAVSSYLRRAARKLDIASRVELVKVYRELCDAAPRS